MNHGPATAAVGKLVDVNQGRNLMHMSPSRRYLLDIALPR